MGTAIEKADTKTRLILADKETFRAYQMREQAKSDLTSYINFNRREGRKAVYTSAPPSISPSTPLPA
jgi:hypothetical protein